MKVRSMVVGGNPLIPDTDRITTMDRVLRRVSFDELPQLINVERSKMLLVGPWPTLAYQVERYDDRQRRRLCVRPGLTGLVSLRGRNALTWSQRIDHDLECVERRGRWLDVRIIAGTPRVLLGGSGVEGHDPNDPLARLDDPTPPSTPSGQAPPGA